MLPKNNDDERVLVGIYGNENRGDVRRRSDDYFLFSSVRAICVRVLNFIREILRVDGFRIE